ncbi:hypothetical protein [Modestobacter italicus]|uniref:hypothetical protein n=1 Tax=Modestobacter italicus (strain DSM 44449 / CECT 9708 / BC 501) TaxID=2732864 RepID=UPI001C93F4D8|nr:hypothetical protein [Modestobacter italicus]
MTEATDRHKRPAGPAEEGAMTTDGASRRHRTTPRAELGDPAERVGVDGPRAHQLQWLTDRRVRR